MVRLRFLGEENYDEKRERIGFKMGVALFMAALANLFFFAPAEAQLASPGNNAVYNSSGSVVLSPSFIDASVFVGTGQGQGSDICDVLFKILSGDPNFFKNGYPSTGAVIDARGISGSRNHGQSGHPHRRSRFGARDKTPA